MLVLSAAAAAIAVVDRAASVMGKGIFAPATARLCARGLAEDFFAVVGWVPRPEADVAEHHLVDVPIRPWGGLV